MTRQGAGILAALGLLACLAPAAAHHVPKDVDVPAPWAPLPDDGYLDFMAPSQPIEIAAQPGSRRMGIGGIYREEHTGFTLTGGAGVVDHPYDNDAWAGDRADFDWVQEHRPDETGVTYGGSNHPRPGAMAWTIAPTTASPHRTAGEPHGHSAAETPPGPLPELGGGDYRGDRFNVVDVFAAIARGEDEDSGGRREAALDYDLWFVDLVHGLSTHGVVIAVFVPGWSEDAGSDDFVARWVPATAGAWNAVVIDPPFRFGHDKITEIDAVRAAPGLGLTVALPPEVAAPD